MSYLNLKPVEFGAMGKRNQEQFHWQGRIMLPKYDGCFVMVGFLNGRPDCILSRTGEVVKSMDHIFDALMATYPWLRGAEGGLMFLGEAWIPSREFSDISGIFRRQRAQPSLGFAPFDVVDYGHTGAVSPRLFSPSSYEARLKMIQINVEKVRGLIFPPVPSVCEDEAHAWRYAKALKQLGGYDGAVVSDPHATYTPGAGKAGEFIKVKPKLSYSLEVVDVLPTRGAKTGRFIGTPVVRFKGGKTCGVGTGFDNDVAAGWYLHPGLIIGKIIEVEAMGLTSGGLLREPSFKGVRDDVTKADY